MKLLLPQELKVLYLSLLGILFMLGLVKKKHILSFIAALIWVPMALSYAQQIGLHVWETLPVWQSVGLGIAGMFVLLLVLMMRSDFVRELMINIIAAGIYDVMRWMLFMPFRFLRWLFRGGR